MHFHYRVTFTEYIRCFSVTTSHDLVTLTFDLLTFSVSCIVLLMPDPHTIFIILRLAVTELRLLNLITFTFTKTVTAHAPCHMTYNRGGGKNSPHF